MTDLNKYALTEYIDLEYLLSGLKIALHIQNTTEEDFYFTDILNRGLRRLRNNGIFLSAEAQLPIDGNNQAILPDGFNKFVKAWPIVFCDAAGKAVKSPYSAPSYINNTFFKCSPYDPPDFVCGGTVNVEDGVIYFSSDVTAQWCKIRYQSTNLDCFGNIRIPAVAEETLLEWGQWQYKMRNEDRYSQTTIQTHKILYSNGKKMLKGLFNLPDSVKREYIGSRVNSII